MRASKETIIAGMALIAAVGGFAVAGIIRQPDKSQGQAMETQTEVQTEQETSSVETEALEYVTDENWDTMVHVYSIIMNNSVTAEDLVANGQSDPDDVVRRTSEIIEYGKNCERDNLLNQEAEEVLRDMVDVADDMLTLIKDGGGEIIEIPTVEEARLESDEGAEEVGAGAEGAEATESTGNADISGDVQGRHAGD